MKELCKNQLEFLIGQMEALEKEHPKAQIVYDTEKNCVQIKYPLPHDFFEVRKLFDAWNLRF